MTKKELQDRFKKFAVGSFRFCESLNQTQGNKILSNQLIKSSSSAAANYRAACRAKSTADFINKFKIVEEETDESVFWFEFADDLKLTSEKAINTQIKEGKELPAIVTASLKMIKSTLK